jgi:hypothetical protein
MAVKIYDSRLSSAWALRCFIVYIGGSGTGKSILKIALKKVFGEDKHVVFCSPASSAFLEAAIADAEFKKEKDGSFVIRKRPKTIVSIVDEAGDRLKENVMSPHSFGLGRLERMLFDTHFHFDNTVKNCYPTDSFTPRFTSLKLSTKMQYMSASQDAESGDKRRTIAFLDESVDSVESFLVPSEDISILSSECQDIISYIYTSSPEVIKWDDVATKRMYKYISNKTDNVDDASIYYSRLLHLAGNVALANKKPLVGIDDFLDAVQINDYCMRCEVELKHREIIDIDPNEKKIKRIRNYFGADGISHEVYEQFRRDNFLLHDVLDQLTDRGIIKTKKGRVMWMPKKKVESTIKWI